MSLAHLLPHIRELPAAQRVLAAIEARRRFAVLDLPSAVRPALMAATLETLRRPSLIVVGRGDRAEALSAAVNEYLPSHRQTDVWPAPEALPYEQLPFDLSVATRRVMLLDRLCNLDHMNPPIVIASVHGLTQLLLDPEDLRTHRRLISVGDRLDVTDLVSWATEHGYQSAPLVQEPGAIARRGGIVDIFPPGADQPARIDLFGDEVESIRSFNTLTQRSGVRLTSILLLPPADLPLWRLPTAALELSSSDLTTLRPEVATEWQRLIGQMELGITPASLDLFAPYLVEQPRTLLDYIGPEGLAFMDEPDAIDLAGHQLDEQALELQEAFVSNGELPVGLRAPVMRWSTVATALSGLSLIDFGSKNDARNIPSVSAEEFTVAPLYSGRLTDAVDDIGRRLGEGWRVVIATDQVDRVTELLEERDIFPRTEKQRVGNTPAQLPVGAAEVRASDLDGGWMAAESHLLLISDLELFGFRKQTRRGTPRSSNERLAFAASLNPGEFVVHVDHGIAKFIGLVRMSTSGVEREYMLLEYARGDKLYVPVDQSDRVSRYSGGGVEPAVSRLGSGEWVRTKQRVRRAAREMAFDLIQLYAAREEVTGHNFGPDTTWDGELAESFPYFETMDQQRAIDDVRGDLETIRPMDRLVCGDVGFGKTEVAIRAAFKVVNGGRQVAILVPTTVLALQHFATFAQRLASFPVRIEMLSRLKSKREQRTILEGLKDGGVDIVIGTHRLVQRDVVFKDLGLVVIDEEQRFGVRHKEFFKRLRTEVHVLTMSATPIPRTLHLALAGVRDISVIDTPPQSRLPIRTFVTEFSAHLAREVILREIDRGGQAYIVHNRVYDIDRFAHKLRQLLPEARIGVGHGQMDEAVLEEVVLAFVRHDYDVLVSTTIIESGVDIPNVNTIIIDNADTLGLTQLYQLRGRVGRGPNRAYAYLLYRPGKVLTREAQERLDAIQEATELGAGLRIAMRDLEIRGAGNILGAEQSGHIADVGFELYIRLLSQAVEEVRRGSPGGEINPVTLDLPLSALIPADYVADTELRLAMYRRIAAVPSLRDLDTMRAELVDRFGPIPAEVEHLLALIALRLRCEELGIESIIERERTIVIRPVLTTALDARTLNQALGRALRLTPNSLRLYLPDLEQPWQTALDLLLDEIERALPSTAA